MPGLHVALLLYTLFQDAHGVLHAPGYLNILEVLAGTRFLCASYTSAEQKYTISMRWGHSDLRMPLKEQQNAEVWSTSTVPAAGQEPLTTCLLTQFCK